MHWRLQDRGGFICHFKESLFPVSGAYHKDPQRSLVQVAYDHKKELALSNASELPVKVPLQLTLTPLDSNIKELNVQVSPDGDDVDSVGWEGLTEKWVSLADRQVLEPLQLTFTALLRKPGIFDLNQLAINATVDGQAGPVNIMVKDEMIVQVTLASFDNEQASVALIDI